MESFCGIFKAPITGIYSPGVPPTWVKYSPRWPFVAPSTDIWQSPTPGPAPPACLGQATQLYLAQGPHLVLRKHSHILRSYKLKYCG